MISIIPCDYDKLECPRCSLPATSLGTTHTLVGYFGEDGNHYWESAHCTTCDFKFFKEYVPRGRKVWYTEYQGKKILRGIPGCCEEGYQLTHDCGGEMHHSLSLQRVNQYGQTNTHHHPSVPMFWQCLSCGGHEIDTRYPEYSTQEALDQKIAYFKSIPPQEPIKLNWTITEEIGEAYINPRALAMIKSGELKI